MTKIKKISTEVIFYITDKPAGQETGVAVVINDETTNMKKRVKWSLRSNPASSGCGSIKEYSVQNTGFRLSFPEHNDICNWSSKVNLRIESDSLNKVAGGNRSYIIQLDTKNFLSAIQENNISISTSGKLSGEYCLVFDRDRQLTNIVLEDSSDKDIMLAKKIGKLVDEGRGTSKWEPGHMYYLKQSKKYIVYLGHINDIFLPNYYYYGKTYELFATWGSSVMSSNNDIIKASGKLFVYVDPLVFCKNKFTTLTDFIIKLLKSLEGDELISGLGTIAVRDSGSSLSGVDIGEIMPIDGNDKEHEAEMIMKNLCYQAFSTITDTDEILKKERFLSLILPKALTDFPVIRKVFLNKKCSAWINATGYSSSKIIQTEDDIMDSSITRYVKNLFNKDVIKLTDEELKDLKHKVFNGRVRK